MPVAQIFLSAFISVLFKKLASGELLNFAHREGIHTRMKNWSGMLLKIQAVLSDAEEKQMKDKAVELWLDDLQDLAYDLDDVLDEFATEALRCKLTTEPQPSTSKVRALFPICCTGFSPSSVMFNSRMRSKIEEIGSRLQYITQQRSELNLVMVSGGTSTKTGQRPATTSLIHEPCIYGRDKDKREIVEFLLRDESGDNKIGIIPIVGMGGVGKTTLAQMVYNDEEVKEHFDLKAWVCVSDDFDAMRITKAILESVTSRSCDFKELDKIQVELKQTSAGKKFLIVLDDVWNKKYSDWNVLKSPFNDGAQGGKVMVTTRNRDVALMMGTVSYHVLELLSNDDCWSVFAQHAFKNRSINANPNLVSIGRAIVEKCAGLPLAARTLGGLLQCKVRDDEWDDVLNSKMWDLSDEESDMLPALRLSYHHLPSHLKQCFAYCAILPKAYAFEEDELVLLWMAEGLIQHPTGKKQMASLGGEYFHELLSRSFFQPSSGNSSKFVMHDLINDLALFVSRDICFRWEDNLEDDERSNNLKKARHLSFIPDYHNGIEKFGACCEAKQLRTFLPFSLSRHSLHSSLTNNAVLDLLAKLRCVRVFSLSNYRITELPSSIGDLKHLRYLDLSYTPIERLPESLGTLYNLQTLMLRECVYLEKLPTDIGNLINLCHLDITDTNSLEQMPLGIGKLASLQTLSKFIVSKDNGIRIRELGNLQHLKGMLHMSGLENVSDPQDTRGARLHDKQGLDFLRMEWSDKYDASRNGGVEMQVLNMLQPHTNLKKLIIRNYCGSKFPTWLGNPMFSNMVHIRLEDCKNCTSLPRLGQLPSLKYLSIEGMSAIKQVGSEFYGQGCLKPFPLLETLIFYNMPEWENWFPLGVGAEFEEFSNLRKLHIKRCPKLLGKVPNHLPRLKKLAIWKCPKLVVELPSLPALLEIRGTLALSSHNHLVIDDVSIPDSLCDSNAADEAIIANTTSKHLSSVTSLDLKRVRNLTSLNKRIAQGLMGLKKLNVVKCGQLVTLWQNEGILQNCLPALQHLEIRECPLLVSLFEVQEGGKEQELHGLPCIMGLQFLQIYDCQNLEKLPRGLRSLVSLGELRLVACPSLVSFPEKLLPPTLKTLKVSNCNALQSLTEWMVPNNYNNNYSLEYLDVSYCASLTNLSSKSGLPSTLKGLKISVCEKLESIIAEEGMKINCPSLESIRILLCKNLKSLPDAEQNNNLRNLRELVVVWCNNLESLPEGWFPATNLRKLNIWHCEKMQSLPHRLYNNNNNNLSSLIVKISKLPSEWDFNKFSSLKKLRIGVEDMVSFPEDGMLLPTSLLELFIRDSPNLEKLSSKEFQNLTSLEKLVIKNCPRLTSLPEEGLPPLLSELSIIECPILKQLCEKGKGQYWPLIAHIPNVRVMSIASYTTTAG